MKNDNNSHKRNIKILGITGSKIDFITFIVENSLDDDEIEDILVDSTYDQLQDYLNCNCIEVLDGLICTKNSDWDAFAITEESFVNNFGSLPVKRKEFKLNLENCC